MNAKMKNVICPDGLVAVKSFACTLLAFLLVESICIYFVLKSVPIVIVLTLLVLLCTTIFVLRCVYTLNDFQIAIRASILGCIFALGIYVYLETPPHISPFGLYMCVMSFFHFSEYVAIAIVQPNELSTNSFVINHSPQYIIAAVSSWIEFFVEAYTIPDIKEYQWISVIGLVICILGEALRKVSMLTAGSSFNHLVVYEKTSDHQLVTHGVYGWFRHPSYVGWFYWSIGTQIILINPICVIGYTVASWMFFNGRIFLEEITLLNFYGQNYCDYQQKVWTGIPFIDGYRIN